MATAVTHPLVTEFLDVVMHSPEEDLRMEQIVLKGSSLLLGASLREANIRQAAGTMVLAVNQGGKLITNPPLDLVFREGDELIALGTEEQLAILYSLAGA
jgi:K+/H+ antiporter YhaU regulatory subunit KhtT